MAKPVINESGAMMNTTPKYASCCKGLKWKKPFGSSGRWQVA